MYHLIVTDGDTGECIEFKRHYFLLFALARQREIESTCRLGEIVEVLARGSLVEVCLTCNSVEKIQVDDEDRYIPVMIIDECFDCYEARRSERHLEPVLCDYCEEPYDLSKGCVCR